MELSREEQLSSLSIVDREERPAARYKENFSYDFLRENFEQPQWKMTLDLDPEAMRNGAPLTVLLSALEQIPGISNQLNRIETVLAELYANALDHGVLRMQSREKDSPAGFAKFYQQRKAKLAELTEGSIHFELRYIAQSGGGKLIIRIEDSGDGFDYRLFQSGRELSGKKMTVPYGRGLTLVNSLCDSLCHYGRGNIVKVTCCWSTVH